jgi:chemotaxis signal transduction protein
VASRKIVPLPSRKLELLGLAGHRGRLVAVYSLAALLGYGVDGKTTSWLALVGAHEPVGLGFEAFDGFLRVRSGDIHAAHAVEGAGPQAGEVVVVGTQSRRIVDIPSTLGMLDVHTGAAGSLKES